MIVKLVALLIAIAALFGAGAFVGYSYSQKKVLTVALSALEHDAGKVEKLAAVTAKRETKVTEILKVIHASDDECGARRAPDAVLTGLDGLR